MTHEPDLTLGLPTDGTPPRAPELAGRKAGATGATGATAASRARGVDGPAREAWVDDRLDELRERQRRALELAKLLRPLIGEVKELSPPTSAHKQARRLELVVEGLVYSAKQCGRTLAIAERPARGRGL